MTRIFTYLAAALALLTFAGCGDVPGSGATVATNTAALKPLPPATEDRDLPVTPLPLTPSTLPATGATPATEQPPGQPANGPAANPVQQNNAPAVSQPASGDAPAPKAVQAPPPASGVGDFVQGLLGSAAAAKTPAPGAPTTPSAASPASGQEKIVIAGAEITRTNAGSIHFDITYSFAQGQPVATNWYTVALREHAGASRQPLQAAAKIEGSELGQQGHLTDNIQIGGRAASFDIHIIEAASRGGEGRQISDVFEAPIHRDLTRERKATPAAGPEASPAGVGVGAQGKGYGAGIVTTPVAALFAAKESIVFKIQIPQAMKFFEAQNNRKPSSHEEFMEKIIKDNQITLPELPAGEKYIYDPQAGELMYTHPKE